jgi:hypothetical protein
MENIYISTPGRLEKLHQRLFDAEHRQKRSVGQMVRNLRITNGREMDWTNLNSLNYVLLRIILHLPRLDRYFMDAMTTIQTHLIAMSRIAVDLTSLTIFVDSEGPGICEVINGMQKLRSLSLEFNNDTWQLAPEYPIQLSTVTHVSWIAPGTERAMLLLLSRCRFADECHMNIRVVEASPDRVSVLQQFFQAHTILSLKIAMPADSLSVLSAEIMHIPCVVFNGVVPPLEMMQTRPLPDTITIRHLNMSQNEAQLWQLLIDLYMGSDVLAKSTTLRLCRGEEQDWDWLDRATGDAGFVGKLLPWAVKLHRRGIIVVDKYGENVSGFMPKS